MSDQSKVDRNLKMVLIAGAGLTLSISADVMADISSAAPQDTLAIFRQAVLEGKVQLAVSGQAVKEVDKLQDFSDAFKNHFYNGTPG